MKIDIASFFFNSRIEGKTATSAWGTSIGQNKTKECRIETEKFGVNELLIGMLYKVLTDTSTLDISAGSSQSELCLAAIFDKVYINNIPLPNCSFGLLLLKETTKSHYGRRRIAYPPYLKLDGEPINQKTIDEIPKALGISQNGCWFIYDISIKNQDELHLSAVVVNAEHEMIYKGESKDRSSEWRSLISAKGASSIKPFEPKYPLQVIYYGAPGTGKSHQTDKLVEGDKQNKIHQRTTFHPDSDYSSFVGCYKPSKENGELTYKFVAQAFLKAYVAAWKNPEHPYYLIIEEINRGNCAQIFGDIFQLLDRREDGFSKYHITSDTDIKTYLRDEAFADVSADELPSIDGINNEQIIGGEIMQLPSNLHIYATMNTSDQSLFPIDSAFKRRWEWEYKPIEQPADPNFRDWKIVTDDGAAYDWWAFLNAVNDRIFDTTQSEDKKMGYWFTKADAQKRISHKKFIGKVLFYLWNDVFKDYARTESTVFKVFTDKEKKDTEEYTFTDFFRSEGVTERIHRLMFTLEVEREDWVAPEVLIPAPNGETDAQIMPENPKEIVSYWTDFKQKLLEGPMKDAIESYSIPNAPRFQTPLPNEVSLTNTYILAITKLKATDKKVSVCGAFNKTKVQEIKTFLYNRQDEINSKIQELTGVEPSWFENQYTITIDVVKDGIEMDWQVSSYQALYEYFSELLKQFKTENEIAD